MAKKDQQSKHQKIRKWLLDYRNGKGLVQKTGYDQLVDRVTRYVFLRFKDLNHEDLKEITSKIMVKIYNKSDHLDEINNLNGWLNKVSYNTAIDHIRSMKTKMDENIVSADYYEVIDLYLWESYNVPDLIDISCLELVIEEYLDQTKGLDDQLLIKHMILGSSHADIAIETGRSKSAIATCVLEIRKKLKVLKDRLC